MMRATASLALAAIDSAKKEEKRITKTGSDHENKGQNAPKAPLTTVIPFRDCSQDPIYKALPQNKLHRGSAGALGHFPTILHILLSRAESCNYHDIVSWRPHGRCFVVYDRSLFVQKIMPMYFRQSQFPSFQRQCNLYGFRCVLKKNADYGAYYHENFLRTRPDLCERMQRPSIRGKDSAKKDNELTQHPRTAKKILMEEPNFFKMTPMPPTTEAETIGDDNFAPPNLTDVAPATMSVLAHHGAYNVPRSPVSGHCQARGGEGGVGTNSNGSSRGNLMEYRGTSAPASANAIVALDFTIPSPSSWNEYVMSNIDNTSMGNKSNMALALLQEHGPAFTPSVITHGPMSSQPGTADMLAIMAGSGDGGGRGDAIFENLVCVGHMAYNHEPTNCGDLGNNKNKNNLQDLMALLEPTPIDPSVLQDRSRSSSMGDMPEVCANNSTPITRMFKISSSDSQLHCMLNQQQRRCGGGAVASPSIQRKRPKFLQVTEDDQDDCMMAGFLSDVDFESDHQHQHSHRHALALNQASSCLLPQVSSGDPLSFVSAPALATQQQQLHMHQALLQDMALQHQQQEQVDDDSNYTFNGSAAKQEQCESSTVDRTCIPRLVFKW